jgi:Excalibur calcium-binding domain
VRKLILISVALATVAAVPANVGAATNRKCDRNYRGACLRPNVSDYDCAGGSGNGPYYVRGPIRVVGRDHYRLDADHDGIACE